MDKYTLERDGQIDFYKSFLPRIDPAKKPEDILADNNDGVLNGNLLEFKLHVTDLGAVLFQCVKYLSALRIKGKPVPANILVIDLNAATAWLYRSADYLAAIETPYTGAASKGNGGFAGGDAEAVFRYSSRPADAERLIATLREDAFTRIHIDENCIVGWAQTFYSLVPGARKEDFIGDDATGLHKTRGEIRRPHHLARYILPYKGKSNIKFKYLMDRLNDTLQKKNLGAFYTHSLYARKSLELVRAAIARVPEGNDYVIIDRCAGTGNLEEALTDEELSHCIVSPSNTTSTKSSRNASARRFAPSSPRPSPPTPSTPDSSRARTPSRGNTSKTKSSASTSTTPPAPSSSSRTRPTPRRPPPNTKDAAPDGRLRFGGRVLSRKR